MNAPTDPRELVDSATRLERRGALLIGFGLPFLFGSIFSVPFGFFAILSQSLSVSRIAFVAVLCGLAPAIATALLWPGIRARLEAVRRREIASRLHGRSGLTPADVTAAASADPDGVDAARYRTVRRKIFARALVYTACASVTATIALFIFIMFAIWLPGATLDGQTIAALAIAIVLGVVIPGAGAVLLGWRARVRFRDWARLRQLVAALGSGTVHTLGDLAGALGLAPVDTEQALGEAIGSGLYRAETLVGLRAAPYAPPTHSGLVERAPAAPATMAPGWQTSWIGRVLGDHVVEAPLGEGGMGAVFRARHRELGTLVAIKILHPSRFATPDALRRFEREASAAATLHHPGIVRLHELAHAADGTAYLVMELLEGETLEARLARHGALGWPEAGRIGLAVGQALAAAHAAGLLHRDLKPANIFLARRGPVVVDFGLAKHIGPEAASSLTSSGAVVGTPLYMSPEQARGEDLDPRSDLYALAVVVFEMLSGTPPFFDKTLAEVHARLLREAAPLASSRARGACPAALDPFLARALATSRDDRFADVPELLRALEGVMEERHRGVS